MRLQGELRLDKKDGGAEVERGAAQIPKHIKIETKKKTKLHQMMQIRSHHGSLCSAKTSTVKCGGVGGCPMRNYKGNGLNKSSRIKCGVSAKDFMGHRYCLYECISASAGHCFTPELSHTVDEASLDLKLNLYNCFVSTL